MVVNDDDPVDLTGGVELGQPVHDRLRVGVAWPVGESGPVGRQVVAAEVQRRAALATGYEPPQLRPLRLQLAAECERAAQDLRVEPAGEPAVAGHRKDRGGA